MPHGLVAKKKELSAAELHQLASAKEREATVQERATKKAARDAVFLANGAERTATQKAAEAARQNLREMKRARRASEAASLQAGHDADDPRAWRLAQARRVAEASEEALLLRLTREDECERGKYRSFCANIAGSELEQWVADVFDAVDMEGRGEIELADLLRLGGKADGGSVLSLFARMDSIEMDGVVSMQEFVQFLANLWDFGGDALVKSALANFETLLALRDAAIAERLAERSAAAATFAAAASFASHHLRRRKSSLEPVQDLRGEMMGEIEEERYVEAASDGIYARIDAVFEGMDFDGNGTIDKEELAELINDEAVSTEIMPLLDNIDADETITKEEFRHFFEVMSQGLGQVGIESVLITFETLLRLRGLHLLEEHETKKRAEDAKRHHADLRPTITREGSLGSARRRGSSGQLVAARWSTPQQQQQRARGVSRLDLPANVEGVHSSLPVREDPTHAIAVSTHSS